MQIKRLARPKAPAHGASGRGWPTLPCRLPPAWGLGEQAQAGGAGRWGGALSLSSSPSSSPHSCSPFHSQCNTDSAYSQAWVAGQGGLCIRDREGQGHSQLTEVTPGGEGELLLLLLVGAEGEETLGTQRGPGVPPLTRHPQSPPPDTADPRMPAPRGLPPSPAEECTAQETAVPPGSRVFTVFLGESCALAAPPWMRCKTWL